MKTHHVTLLGKAVQSLMRLRGGGSAFPGLLVEKIDKNFIKRSLSDLPRGIVVISGTNGKTTTTKIVVELLKGQGLKVFTNKTGSNFSRGVAAALLSEMTITSKLDADIAVLELDEAHAVPFVKAIPPTYSLLLNVMRDQLDRFTEIDKTASLLEEIAQATTKKVVLNREDQRVADIAQVSSADVSYFGFNPELKELFSNADYKASKPSDKPADVSVMLDMIDGDHAKFVIDGKTHGTDLKLRASYNMFNAAGAMALVQDIMGSELDTDKMIASLETISPAFGRGEHLTVKGSEIDIILVKNPSGFQLSLASFNDQYTDTMIAINDDYADGRDMSWLWDVDFTKFVAPIKSVSGVRAYDMALRLKYDDIKIDHISTDISACLRHFLSGKSAKKQIFCSYTAMLAIRKEITKLKIGETES
ncbi:MAG: MurT ligase domain-containing protein [bacterium]|nr:MurT ligase domain-containing protein [bacterium]